MLVDDEGHACISDFGLSIMRHGIDSMPISSIATSPRGTTRWMAPELHFPEKYGFKSPNPTSSSDVYAFACLILEVRKIVFHLNRACCNEGHIYR